MALVSTDFQATWQFASTLKSFSFKDIADYNAQGVGLNEITGVIKVVDPANNTHYNNTNFSDPDIDPDVSLTSVKTILLPTDANGNVLQGTYTITYTVRGSSGTISPAVDVSKTITHVLAYTSPTVKLTLTANCLKPLMQSVDGTNYLSGTTTPTITRAHKIIYPEALGKTSVTGVAATLETNVFFTVKDSVLTHSSSLTSTLSYNFATNVFVTDSISGSKFVDVACDGELCDIYCCVKAEWDRYNDNKGTNKIKAEGHLANFHQMTGLMELIRTALECGKDTDISTFTQRIQDIGNCESGCGCDDGTPILVTGLGGGVNTFVVTSGGTPVEVTSVISGTTTTYTVKLATAFVTKVNDSFNSTVAAGSGATVITAVDKSGNKTFTVSLTSTVTETNLLSFIALLTRTSNDPTITIQNVSKYGAAFNSSPTVKADNTGADWLTKTASFTVAAMWSTNGQGSRVFKPIADVIEHTKITNIINVILGFTVSTPELIITGTRGFLVEIYDQQSTSFRIRFIDPATGAPMTGRYFNDDFVSSKLQITLTS